MERVLTTLIEGARLARDRQSVAVRTAVGMAEQARHTLDRLDQYRGECLARSPAVAGGMPDREMLLDYQRFVGRLDQAIGLQGHEHQVREGHLEAAQLKLLDHQRRLMALETLVKRRAAAKAVKAARQDQRDTDEFAARAVRRLDQDNTA